MGDVRSLVAAAPVAIGGDANTGGANLIGMCFRLKVHAGVEPLLRQPDIGCGHDG